VEEFSKTGFNDELIRILKRHSNSIADVSELSKFFHKVFTWVSNASEKSLDHYDGICGDEQDKDGRVGVQSYLKPENKMRNSIFNLCGAN